MNTILAIDPGLKNCAAVLCEVSRDERTDEIKVSVKWSQVHDLSTTGTNPDFDAAADFAEEMMVILANEREVDAVLIEYQPPMNTRANPALVCWNSSVEGFFFGYLIRQFPVKHSYSSVVKKFFRIAGGGHSVNKRLAKKKAQELLEPSDVKMTDHEADCVLMCVFEFIKREN